MEEQTFGLKISGHVDNRLHLADVSPRLRCADLGQGYRRGDGCIALDKCTAPVIADLIHGLTIDDC